MKGKQNSCFETRIASVATAVPPFVIDQAEADGLITQHYRNELSQRSLDVLHQVMAHPSIKTRHLAVSSFDELLSLKNEDPDKRIERFTSWSVELSAQSAETAMRRAGITVDDVSVLIVNTCTGYICPGIGTYLVERLGLRSDVVLHDLVGSGCAGAIPNLLLGRQMIAHDPDAVALCISVEICTATFQMGNDLSLIISNAIFGDGASASVLWNRETGVRILSENRSFIPEYRNDVRYIHRSGALHNRITSRLPLVIGERVPPFITHLLESQHLAVSDIKYWCLHPGGAKMMDTLQENLALTDSAMETARTTYSRYGNMSSPTVIFELDDILNGTPQSKALCVMVAYGAGLSIHGCILEMP